MKKKLEFTMEFLTFAIRVGHVRQFSPHTVQPPTTPMCQRKNVIGSSVVAFTDI